MYSSSSELNAELCHLKFKAHLWTGTPLAVELFFALELPPSYNLLWSLWNRCYPSLLSSTCILTVCSQLTEEKWSFYHSSRAHVHRPSCVATEVERLNALMQKKIGQSILGKVRKQHTNIRFDIIYKIICIFPPTYIDHFIVANQKGSHITTDSLNINYTKYMLIL